MWRPGCLHARCRYETCHANKSLATGCYFDFFHLVLAAATCLPHHVSYPRSCQKAGKIWEVLKNLAEPAFSTVTLYDTFVFNPKLQMLHFLSTKGDKLTTKALQPPEMLWLCAPWGVLVLRPGLLLSFQAPAHTYRMAFLFVQKKKNVKCKYLSKHLEDEKKQISLIYFWKLQVRIWITPYLPLSLGCGLWCSQTGKPEVQILGRELTWRGQSWNHKGNEGKLGKARRWISAPFAVAEGLVRLKPWLLIWTGPAKVHKKRLFPYCSNFTFFISIDQQRCTALLRCVSEIVPDDADTGLLSFSWHTGFFFFYQRISFLKYNFLIQDRGWTIFWERGSRLIFLFLPIIKIYIICCILYSDCRTTHRFQWSLAKVILKPQKCWWHIFFSLAALSVRELLIDAFPSRPEMCGHLVSSEVAHASVQLL